MYFVKSKDTRIEARDYSLLFHSLRKNPEFH